MNNQFKFYRTIPRLLIAVLPICALVFVSFSFPSERTAAVEKRSKALFTGQELFRGIFFRQGTFAQQIKSYRQTFVAGGAPEALTANIEKWLETKDPAFFNKFKAAITSGSSIAIRDMMRQTDEMLQEQYEQARDLTARAVKTQAVAASEGKTDGGKATLVSGDEPFYIFIVLPSPPVLIDNPFIIVPPMYIPDVQFTYLIMLPMGPPTLPLAKSVGKTAPHLFDENLLSQVIIDEIAEM